MPVSLEDSRKATLANTPPKDHEVVNKLYDHPDQMTESEMRVVTRIIEDLDKTKIEPIRKLMAEHQKV